MLVWGFFRVAWGFLEGIFVLDLLFSHGFLNPPSGLQGRLGTFYSMWVEDKVVCKVQYYRFPFTAPNLLSLHVCPIMCNFEAVCLFGYRIYKVRRVTTASA